MPSGGWLLEPREEERRLRRDSPAPDSGTIESAAACDNVTEGLRLRGFGDPGTPSSAPIAGASISSTPGMLARDDKNPLGGAEG